MKIDEKDEIFDRESAQGSDFDKMYFTDDQLRQGAQINQKAAAGEISWDSAHNWWENIRAGYGYSGGEDGHGYTAITQNAEPFSYASAPSYVDKYSGLINGLLGGVLNREKFTYDPATDPMYQQYEDSYTRMGQQAMEDTLAQVSARTGGLASSYAGAAAQQAYNGYMSALADKVPELRQLAYQMYMDEGDTQRQNLELMQNLEQIAYSRYLNDLNQHNADRNFAYGVKRDQISDNRYAQQQADNKATADKSDAQSRINAYLAADGSLADLDSDLITASGYTDAELMALEKYYADQKAKQAASGNGGGTGSGGGTTKPTLTAAQALSALESGIVNDTTKAAFEYYYGQEWDGGSTEEPAEPETEATISNQHGDSWIYIPGHGRFSYAEVEQYVNSGQVIETYNAETNTYSYKWNNNYKK